jgi:hypothetical protein
MLDATPRPGALALLTLGALFGSFLTDPARWTDRLSPSLPTWMVEDPAVDHSMVLEHMSALEMAVVLADLTPPGFELEVDLAGNRVLARGDRHTMQRVETLVRQLDVPLDVMLPAWGICNER